MSERLGLTCEHDPRERNAEKRTHVRGRRVVVGQGGRVTRTGRGCIDLRGERGLIRGWGGQVRVAEQIYWIQGGLQIRQDQRNQRAVPTSVLENRPEK